MKSIDALAVQAQKRGIFVEEIIPIEIRGKTISADDTIRPGVTNSSLASLKPVFPGWGGSLTTAGNASGVGDGAALCVLTSRHYAEMEGLKILGKWVGSAVVGEYRWCISPFISSDLSIRCSTTIHGNWARIRYSQSATAGWSGEE